MGLFSGGNSSSKTYNNTRTVTTNAHLGANSTNIVASDSFNNNEGDVIFSDQGAIAEAFDFAESSLGSTKAILKQTNEAVAGLAENIKNGGVKWSWLIIAVVAIVFILAVVK